MQIGNSFKAVQKAINAADEQFGNSWEVNDEYLDILSEYCENIDALGDQYQAIMYIAEVDKTTMEIKITLGCTGLYTGYGALWSQERAFDTEKLFYPIAERCVRLEFSSDEDLLKIQFVFPSIWERV